MRPQKWKTATEGETIQYRLDSIHGSVKFIQPAEVLLKPHRKTDYKNHCPKPVHEYIPGNVHIYLEQGTLKSILFPGMMKKYNESSELTGLAKHCTQFEKRKTVGDKMNIQTKYFGDITIDEKDIITFENGIPGFLDEKRFVILPLADAQIYFVMQSVNTPQLAFVVTNPILFYQDYDFTLDDPVVEQLEIQKPEDVRVFNILTLREPFEKTTVNLQAPIIINKKTNKSNQVILNNESYKTRHPLFHSTPQKVKG